MAFSRNAQIGVTLFGLGALAFILGIFAENKKPAGGTAMRMKNVVICNYPYDPSVVLGALSAIVLLFSTVVGWYSVICPYNGISVPTSALFQSMTLDAFIGVAVGTTLLAEGLMVWGTLTEGLHLSRNVHYNLETNCPTAKTGLFGGAAFLSLNATLFWLVCQMLSHNARDDYFADENIKGDYGQVTTTNVGTIAGRRPDEV